MPNEKTDNSEVYYNHFKNRKLQFKFKGLGGFIFSFTQIEKTDLMAIGEDGNGIVYKCYIQYHTDLPEKYPYMEFPESILKALMENGSSRHPFDPLEFIVLPTEPVN